MIDETPELKSLHTLYCQLTQRELEPSMAMLFLWRDWKAKGWDQGDLFLVINHVKQLINAGRRFPESLRLYNLLDQERFAMDLSEARALARIPKVDKGKESVLRATGMSSSDKIEPQLDNVKTPASILKGEKGLKALLKLRDQL